LFGNEREKLSACLIDSICRSQEKRRIKHEELAKYGTIGKAGNLQKSEPLKTICHKKLDKGTLHT
jgi:hypothetical protein